MNVLKVASTLYKGIQAIVDSPSKQEAQSLNPEMQKSIEDHRPQLEHAALKYQVPTELLAGLMLEVSAGDPNKVNSAGAKGLMQLSSDTAKRLGVDSTDPAQSLEGGAKLLRQMLERYHGDQDKAVAAYWFGPGALDKMGMSSKMQGFADSVSHLADGAKVQLQGNSLLKNLEQAVGKITDFDYEKWIQNFTEASSKSSDAHASQELESKKSVSATISEDIGFISAKYESGNRGVGTISSGSGDPGGVSYGVHQLSSNAGTMTGFLNSPEGQPYAQYFTKLKPGTLEFNKAYTAVVNADSEGFAKAQHNFITRTHYEPRLKLATDLGFKVENRGVQEAIYSVSVQHGGANKLLTQISQTPGFKEMSAEQQLKVLYEQRTNYAIKYVPNLERSFRNRYTNELKDTLSLAAQSQAAVQTKPAQTQATDSQVKTTEIVSSSKPSTQNIDSVLDVSNYVYQFNLPNGSTACFTASSLMLKNAGISLDAGYKQLGYFQVAKQSNGQKQDIIDPEQAKAAYSYVDKQLESGRPVVAGISYMQASYNFDKTTDHFVVLVGRGYDADTGQTYYRYYDPGSKIRGISEENRLYINQDGSAQGRSAINPSATYTLSQIRKNPE